LLTWHPSSGYSFSFKINKDFRHVPLGFELDEDRAAIIQQEFFKA
jgi:hypothetical protein